MSFKYTKGWFAAANKDQGGVLIPFEMLCRKGGSGKITNTGTAKEGIVDDIELCRAALCYRLLYEANDFFNIDWHFHLPPHELILSGVSNRLAIAYTMYFLSQRDKNLTSPERLMLSGDVKLDGSVHPIRFANEKYVAMKSNQLTLAVFSVSQEIERRTNIVFVESLGDLACLESMPEHLQKRTTIPSQLRYFGYLSNPS